MPEVLILGALGPDGHESEIKHRVASQYLALGIQKNADVEHPPARIAIAGGDRILLCSDGVTEANNSRGVAFGTQRYCQAASATLQSFLAVVSALDEFRDGQPFNDDVSLVEIHCIQGLLGGDGRGKPGDDTGKQQALHVSLR